MEDRAKFVLIGLFTFAVIIGAFGFVFWFHHAAGGKENATYRVVFDGSVSGLKVGAPVLFNGIRVGEVTDLKLTGNPSEVAVMVSVDKSTPIRSDTQASLEFAGLTGIAAVSLRGVLSSAPPLARKQGEPPTLMAEPNAGKDLSQAVRDTLSRADAVIAANQQSLHNTIKNLEAFSEALARNSGKIDGLVSNASVAMDSFHTLTVNLDKRTASITTGINKMTASATKQIDVVGGDAHRTLLHVDKAVSDLAKHPQRLLFGGG